MLSPPLPDVVLVPRLVRRDIEGPVAAAGRLEVGDRDLVTVEPPKGGDVHGASNRPDPPLGLAEPGRLGRLGVDVAVRHVHQDEASQERLKVEVVAEELEEALHPEGLLELPKISWERSPPTFSRARSIASW